MRFCGHCGARLDEAGSAPAIGGVLRKLVSDQLAARLSESGGEIAEERRLVTAVFADVSGFTALADQLDPEGLVEAINPVLAALTDAAVRYDGYVSKFAGDALLCLFGAPVAHEDDAERALLAAMAMRQALADVVPDLPEHARHLTLHIGVNTGHVVAALFGNEVRTDYSVLGDAVNTAQRLESQTPSGQIYVGDATRAIAGDRFTYEDAGLLTMKGKAEPVRAWRLTGLGDDRAHAAARPLIGRDAELHACITALAPVHSGGQAALGIAGDPGVGKTRLLEEVRVRTNVRWLWARCPSYGVSVPYAPLASLLRARALISPGSSGADARDALRAMLTDDGVPDAVPFLAHVAGFGGDDLDQLDPDALRRGIHDAVAGWLAALAPAALVVEDLHWADPSTISLLQFLAGRPLRATGLIATARRDAAETLGQIIDGPIITVNPLDASAARELVRSLAGDDPVADTALERAGGNPFFLEEIVRLGGGGEIPATIEGVVAARIDRLPGPAASLLQIASVIGRRVPRPLLHAVAGGEIAGAVAPLIESRFLEPDGGNFRFHHAIVQDVVYHRLLRKQQRDLHRLVADAGERIWGDGDEAIEILARHRLLAGDASRAIGLLLRAAERSRRLYANDEAIMHLQQAEEAARTCGDPRLTQIITMLADVLELTGRYDRALGYYQEAREAGGSIRAWTGAASALRKRGEAGAALALIDRGLTDPALDAAALRLEQAWTHAAEFRHAEAIEAAEIGMHASSGRRDAVVAGLLLQRARARSVRREFADALKDAATAKAILIETDDPRGLIAALRVEAGAHRGLGMPDRAASALKHAIALAERTGNVEEHAGCLINLGLAELDRGNRAAAIETHREAIADFARIGSMPGETIATANLARMLVEEDRLAEARATCERALELARLVDRQATTADATWTMAMISQREGAVDRARAQAAKAADIFESLAMPAEAAECRSFAAE